MEKKNTMILVPKHDIWRTKRVF